jgi:hypothetical protein
MDANHLVGYIRHVPHVDLRQLRSIVNPLQLA